MFYIIAYTDDSIDVYDPIWKSQAYGDQRDAFLACRELNTYAMSDGSGRQFCLVNYNKFGIDVYPTQFRDSMSFKVRLPPQ
jgi:hypothetical protein